MNNKLSKTTIVLIIVGVVFGLALIGLVVWVLIFVLAIVLMGDPAPEEPEYPVVYGVRADGDTLLIATVEECVPDSSFRFIFSEDETPGAKYLTVDNEYVENGIIAVEQDAEFMAPGQVPVSYDWRDADSFVVEAISDTEAVEYWYVYSIRDTDLSVVKTESDSQPEGIYYFNGFGWSTPEDIRAKIGVDLLTICSPMES
jgi:hypothetical protein